MDRSTSNDLSPLSSRSEKKEVVENDPFQEREELSTTEVGTRTPYQKEISQGRSRSKRWEEVFLVVGRTDRVLVALPPQ